MADKSTRGEPYALRCPECGGEVVVKRLEVEDELGRETVFLFSCESGDFSASATEKTLNTIMTEIVVARLGNPQSG